MFLDVLREAARRATAQIISFANTDVGADSSTAADRASQTAIYSTLYRAFPEIPILAEERDGALASSLMQQLTNLSILLPEKSGTLAAKTYFSVDPLNGTALFANRCPEYSVSIAALAAGRPAQSCIVQPALGIQVEAVEGFGCFMNHRSVICRRHTEPPLRSLIGLDSCRSVDPEIDESVIRPLTKAFRYVRNLPSVASGVELLQGRTAAWVSSNARHWDVSATALAVQEAGGVAECLDGSPIPWDRVRLPPLLFAVNAKVARAVRSILAGDIAETRAASSSITLP